LLRVLAGALRPTTGLVNIGGSDLAREPYARRRVGMVGHQTLLYGDLTVRENLLFYSRLYGVPAASDRVSSTISELQLGPVADRPVRTLSRGTQQRASFARAMVHDPSILLLDEAETGLDPGAQDTLGVLLRDWSAQGRAVLFTSHRLDWAEAIATRAILLHAGQLVDDVSGPAPLRLPARYALLGENPASPSSAAARESPLWFVSDKPDPDPERPAAGSDLEPAERRRQTPPFPDGGRRASPADAIRQFAAVFAKDVLLEWRTRDAVASMLVFALLALVTFNFALDLRPEVVAAVGPGILWVAVVLGSMLGPGRTFIREHETGTLEGLLLAPLDRGVLFLGKLVVNFVVMAAVLVVSVPAFILLFDVHAAIGPLAMVLAAGTLGLAAVETLLAAVAAHTRAREVMLPVLVLPIIVPILIGVVQATGRALGASTPQDLPWLGLILAFDAIYVAAGVAVFDYVMEE
jgi:heme exporter protein CcmB